MHPPPREEVVQHDHVVAHLHESVHQVGPHEAGAAGDQDTGSIDPSINESCRLLFSAGGKGAQALQESEEPNVKNTSRGRGEAKHKGALTPARHGWGGT